MKTLMPSYSSLNISVGYRIYQRGELHKGKSASEIMSKTAYLIRSLSPKNIVSTLLHDKYARLDFDYVIFGSDFGIALSSAILAARADKTCLLCPGSPDRSEMTETQESLLIKRFSMETDHLRETVALSLNLDSGSSINEILVSEVEKINNIKNRIFILDKASISTDARLESDRIGESTVFFEDKKNNCNDDPSSTLFESSGRKIGCEWNSLSSVIPSVQVDDTKKNMIPGFLQGGYKSLILVGKRIIKVSSTQSEIGVNFASPPIAVGEARYPIGDFERFTPMHRFNDFHSVIKALDPNKTNSELRGRGTHDQKNT